MKDPDRHIKVPTAETEHITGGLAKLVDKELNSAWVESMKYGKAFIMVTNESDSEGRFVRHIPLEEIGKMVTPKLLTANPEE